MTQTTASDPEFRRTYIGGSDAAAVVGVGRWGSPYSVWLEKIGEAPEKDPPSERMLLGSLLEDVVGREWARRERVGNLQEGLFRVLSKQRGYIGGHPDFTGEHPTDGEIVVEVKVSDRVSDWEDADGEPIVPVTYFLQVQHYLAIEGLQVAYIVVLLRGSEIRSFRVPRDEEVIAGLIEAYDDFWTNHVLTGVPPEVDGHEATAEAIKARYPVSDDVEMVGGMREQSLVDALLQVRAEFDEIETRKAELENAIKVRMEKASRLLVPGATVSWKQNKPSVKTDWQSVAKAYRTLVGEASAIARRMAMSDDPDDYDRLTEMEEQLDTLESIHTNTMPGARPFRVTVKREEQG